MKNKLKWSCSFTLIQSFSAVYNKNVTDYLFSIDLQEFKHFQVNFIDDSGGLLWNSCFLIPLAAIFVLATQLIIRFPS